MDSEKKNVLKTKKTKNYLIIQWEIVSFCFLCFLLSLSFLHYYYYSYYYYYYYYCYYLTVCFFLVTFLQSLLYYFFFFAMNIHKFADLGWNILSWLSTSRNSIKSYHYHERRWLRDWILVRIWLLSESRKLDWTDVQEEMSQAR